ncbi:MAG: hypothetical protein MUP45_03905 [Candidatus Marinimicrobia bacterium]|nr:hypothetical protein [Candidatus Neomarinimicrobiota bacterium]
MEKNFLKKTDWLKIGLLIFFLLFFASLLLNYFSFDWGKNFGYLDHQLYWQNLQDLATGKVIYRDFFWEYGFLYLALGLPFFLLGGKTFLGSTLVRLLVFPLMAFFLSFLLGKELLKKGYLLLFLLLLFLFGVNSDFTSLRHLLPELGLIFLIIGLEKKRQKQSLLGSFLIGLSLTSSLEYGLAVLISLGFYFLLTFFSKPGRLVLKQTAVALAVITLPALPYFLYLWLNQALKNFFLYTFQYAQSFYSLSPCRELFPRLNEATLSLSFFQRINLYLIPLFFLILLGWTVFQRKSWWFPLVSSLLVYSLLIFYRVLATPCFGYLTYGLTFLFLVLVFFLSLPKKSTRMKNFLFLFLAWFLLVGSLTLLTQFSSQFAKIKRRTNPEIKTLPVAGIKLEKNLAEEYQKVTAFIQENSQKDDYLYVYPNGPYNQLAQRQSPVSVASTWYLDLAPFLIDKTVRQLEERKPKLIVINVYNGWNIKTLLHQIDYNLHLQKEEIIFEAITTPLEDFISQNYQLAKRFEIAWVLKEKPQSDSLQRYYQPVEKTALWETAVQGLTPTPYLTQDKSLCFQVTEDFPLIQFSLKEPSQQFKLIKIPLKVDLGLSKVFSKFIINFYVSTNDNQNYLFNRQLVSADWQDIWTQLPLEKLGPLRSITLTLSPNQGFIWWGKPKTVCFKEPELFLFNPNLTIDTSAFEIKPTIP